MQEVKATYIFECCVKTLWDGECVCVGETEREGVREREKWL